LNPASVSFGNVPLGKASSKTVTISNAGTASVTITQATVSNSQFTVSGISLPMSMAAGQSGTVTVSVTPTTSGGVNGTLSVQATPGALLRYELGCDGSFRRTTDFLEQQLNQFWKHRGWITGHLQPDHIGMQAIGLTISGVSVSGTAFGYSGITCRRSLARASQPPCLCF